MPSKVDDVVVSVYGNQQQLKIKVAKAQVVIPQRVTLQTPSLGSFGPWDSPRST